MCANYNVDQETGIPFKDSDLYIGDISDNEPIYVTEESIGYIPTGIFVQETEIERKSLWVMYIERIDLYTESKFANKYPHFALYMLATLGIGTGTLINWLVLVIIWLFT